MVPKMSSCGRLQSSLLALKPASFKVLRLLLEARAEARRRERRLKPLVEGSLAGTSRGSFTKGSYDLASTLGFRGLGALGFGVWGLGRPFGNLQNTFPTPKRKPPTLKARVL